MKFHSFIRDGDGWETVKNTVRFSNPHVEVLETEVKTPTRSQLCAWTVVHRKAAAVVAPVTQAGEFLLVRQERIPVRASLWEFPAGQLDDHTAQDDAAIRATALRELREETGYELAPTGSLISLGYFFPSAGFTDEHSHLFLARGVVPCAGGPQHDEHEAITECRAFTTGKLRDMIATHEIRDANTLSAFARMVAMNLIA